MAMHAALAQIDYGLPAAPDVFVVADDPAASLRDIAAVDARHAGTVSLAQAAALLDVGPAVDLVLVEIGASQSALAASLFAQLQDGVEAGRFACVVILPFALVDQAALLLASPGTTLLVDPDAAERRDAVAAAMPEPGPVRVFDGGADAGPPSELRDEVARIARRLAALAAAEPARSRPGDAANDARVDAHLVRTMIRARRMRDQFFAPELFADPAWDMLLDLTAAALEGRDVAVSSLCIAAAVPPTTALRWIKILTDAGLFVRRADPADKRRIFIALADQARDAMLCFLTATQRAGMMI